MAGFQETLHKAATHLRGMTLSQRLAILLGVVLVAGSLAWMVQWAATPEYTPLLNQSFSPEDLATISSGLDTLGEPYRIVGSQVLVPASTNTSGLIARLQQANKLPADTSIGFEQLVAEANPWISQAENTRRWTLAMQTELEQVLSRFTGVRRANVFLNLNAQKATFSRFQPANTASVTLTMDGGAPVPRALALSAARLVAGAVRGLPVENVQVVDSTGRPALDWDDEVDGSLSSLARRQKQLERDTAAKIASQLDYIPDLKVNVQVVLDHTSSNSHETATSDGAVTRKRSYEEQRSDAQRGGQPGVQPNVGAAAVTSASGTQETRTESEQEFQPSIRDTQQSKPAGSVDKIFAAVSISRAYLEGVYRLNNPDADPPTETQIEETFLRQRDRIVRQITKLVYPPSAEQIAVDWHYGPVAIAAEQDSASEVIGAGVSLDLLRRYGPASGLGALALVALFLTMRMARSSVSGEAFGMELGLPKEAIEAAKRAAADIKQAPTASAAGGEPPPAAQPVGVAGDALFEGQEIDDETARVEKMLAQVSEMIEADGDLVAGMVEKWASSN
ncbi:MAG: hypothetical protein D6744_09815 [Planctomycetota bacterium]|nr:MAG: hypothetical protein D6744_09815 [Planctomycetota bacterium]